MAEEKHTKLDGPALVHTSTVESSHVDERKLLRKLDRYVVPGPTLLLLLMFLDRTNVGNARIEGLVVDLHMTGNQFLTTLTIYFIAYVLFEVPCNIILKLTTPRFWLPTLALLWGAICIALGLTRNLPGFLAARFFLGIVESGFMPGAIYYISMWYKRSEQTYRICMFYSASTLAGASGGILAFGLAKMKGIAGLGGWRWIFIIEGLSTIVISLAAYFFIYNYPAAARFLSPWEREHVIGRLKGDNDAVEDEKFTWDGVIQAFKDPKVWLYSLCFHTMDLPICALSLFLPTIINELGYTAAQTQLLLIPPYLTGFVLIIAIAVLSERAKRRAPFIIASSTLATVGFIVLTTSNRPEVSYGGSFMAVSGVYSAAALILAWPAVNVSGQTKRAVASAMQLGIGNLASVIGTQLFRPRWSPKFVVGNLVTVGFLVLNIALVSTLWWILENENTRRDRGERDDRLADLGEGISIGDDDPRWRFRT